MDIDSIIKANEHLIYKIASRFNGVDKDDLYQVGVIGLLNALKNYSKSSNAKFSTYAYDYIFGEMYKLASENRNIKMSKDALKLYKKIEQARYYLAQKMGSMPSDSDLALFLEIDENTISQIVASSKSILSLDCSPLEDTDSLYEVIPERESLSLTDKIAVDDSFQVLSDDEKKIINYRYYQDYTQSETAKILGMTQVMVSRYEKKSIDKMRAYLNS